MTKVSIAISIFVYLQPQSNNNSRVALTVVDGHSRLCNQIESLYVQSPKQHVLLGNLMHDFVSIIHV